MSGLIKHLRVSTRGSVVRTKDRLALALAHTHVAWLAVSMHVCTE